jgi:hypothetical protein
MNPTKCLLALTTMVLVFASLTWAADDKDESDINKRIDASARVLNEVMATPDKAIPDSIMNDARCIAVVPSMIKIAVGFGGNHGKRIATCRTSSRWTAPAPDYHHRRQLGTSARRPGGRSGDGGYKRPGDAALCSPANSNLERMPLLRQVRWDVTLLPVLM